MYETRHSRPLTRAKYIVRLARHGTVALAVVIVSIAVGMIGYEYFEALRWRDAFLEVAMLLGGMGPVHAPQTDAGKLFAGMFALYAGMIFLVVSGILFAPMVHRLLHRFHWEEHGGA
jgi:hypothetical protein